YEIGWTKSRAKGVKEFRVQYIFSTPTEKKHLTKSPAKPILPDEANKILDRIFRNEIKEIPDYYKTANPKFENLHAAIRTLFGKKEISLEDKSEFCRGVLKDYFYDFTVADLDEGDKDKTDLERILLQGKGTCEHRAFLYTVLCQYLGIPAQMISNQCHAFPTF